MKVRDLMTTDVKSCNSDTNLAAAASRMWEGDCGSTQKAICEHRYPKSAHQQGAPQKVTYT
jgi:hypothetical protein